MLTQHLPILPIIFPMLMGALLLLPPLGTNLQRQRITALISGVLLVALAIWLLQVSHLEGTQLYFLGDWKPPFGILFVADRVSALLVLLTAVLALGAMLYATGGEDRVGMHFYPLFMFQITGINGAFLTGDLFNLFVFFEVLLIASYSLLIHGGGKHRTQAGMHYVILNLVGSALFLFALGIIYGTLGTLNMADMAVRVHGLEEDQLALTKAGGLLLLLVFSLKAALLPLHFWLPRTYSAASAPVAALFAIMTKVGIYSIYRVHTLAFGPEAGDVASLAQPWLWPFALLTLAIGTIGVLASHSLRVLAANLVIISVGTLLVAAALESTEAMTAALYYLVHSTLISGALFLLADAIGKQRGKPGDRLVRGRQLKQPVLLGSAFFLAALIAVGMPPFSGFVGKLMLLQAADTPATASWIWPAILISGLASIVALSRAGTTLFWRVSGDDPAAVTAPVLQMSGVWLLLLCSPLLVAFGGPVTEFMALAAEQLFDVQQFVDLILVSGAE
ncbi:monovalent cation/H+ antiporter subunit D [Marinospirillum alkaliphilum]|uniref:Multicomponent K+:H+ antiporter subunit D n=1 Tax=Marinospirillum alkaliphilum DSM 21637 TaxID=1122209 RepID=A0A1K1ZFN4_9GAMM|nr:monovalent cation/H+ antiporter subunit D [Marinospirillum alkaliphilum]SFX72904.1 multicomponent K+:H+ antiporter subunit D [Marinospirillum alkaliphilum DSM 21637]